jgi:hypothetical protein
VGRYPSLTSHGDPGDGVDAALQLGGEADQGVVDAGDVAAVRHRRQVPRPQVGDPRGVEDQGGTGR